MRLTLLCLATTIVLVNAHTSIAGLFGMPGHRLILHPSTVYDNDSDDRESFAHGMFWNHSFWGGFRHGFDPEGIHEHFEDKLADLMEEFDEASSENPDYPMTEEFDEFVDDVQWLSDRHEHFLDKVDYKIEKIGDTIIHLEEKIGQFEERAEEWLERDDLPEKWQMWIEDHSAWLDEHLTMKIDELIDKQTMLIEDQTTYQMFQDDLQSYLDELLSLGESVPEEDPEAVVELITTLAATEALVSSELNVENSHGGSAASIASAAVPEPATLVMLLLGLPALLLRRHTAGS